MKIHHFFSLGAFCFSIFSHANSNSNQLTLPQLGGSIPFFDSNKKHINAFTVIEPASGSSVLIGRGFNSVSGEVGGPCVDSGPVETLKSDSGTSLGQKVSFSMQQIQSISELKEQLSIGATGSLGLGVWSGDAKAKYMKENNYTNNKFYLLLKVLVENQTEILKDYKLTPSAAALYSRSGKEAFLKACGDKFIAARVSGGEFIAILEMETRSKEEKRSIEAKIGAAGVFWKIGPEFGNLISNLSKEIPISFTVFRSGGSGDLPQQDSQKLIQYALSFPEKVKIDSNGSWPIMVTAESYDIILDKPSTDFIHLDTQQRVMNKLAEFQIQAKEQWNEVDYILNNMDSFINPNLSSLKKVQKSLSDLNQMIQEAAINCAADVIRGCSLPSLNWPELNLPHPTQSVRRESNSTNPVRPSGPSSPLDIDDSNLPEFGD